MPRIQMTRRVVALGLLAAASACLGEATRPDESRTVVGVRADTTPIGELVFIIKTGVFDTAITTTGTRILYRNTTNRRIENLAMALQAVVPSTNPLCLTPVRPVVDVVLGAVEPGEERTLLPGLFPASVTLFIANATSGTASLVSPNAGRWQGRIEEYRGAQVVTRSVLAVSRSDGAAVFYGASPSDRFVYTGNVGPARQLLFYDGVSCANNWRAIDTTATVVVRADSVVFSGRAQSASGVPVQPDSFVLRLGRR